MTRDGLLEGGSLTIEWAGASAASVSITGHRSGTATRGVSSASFPYDMSAETTWDFSENCTVTVVITYLSVELLNRDYRIHDSSETRIEPGIDFNITTLEKVLGAVLQEGGGSVGSETTRATAAESTLQTNINAKASTAALTTEVDRATAAEAAAQAYAIARANHTGSQAQSTVTNLVSDLAAKATTTALTTETSRATAAEDALTTNVNTRATTSALTTETSRSTAAEAALQNLTNTTFVTGLNNAYVGKALIERNVLDYGADRTGVADSTAAFVAALAAGNAVYAPAGTYLVEQIQPGSGQQLRGDGPGRTIITSNTDQAGVIQAAGSVGSRLTKVIVRDLTVDCITRSGTNQAGVVFRYCDYSLIRNVEASNAWINGIDVFYSTYVRVEDCDVHDNKTFGMLFYQSADCTVSGNHVHDQTYATRSHLGIQFKSSQRCAAVNNKVSNIGGYGIYTWCDYTGAGSFINDYAGNLLVDQDHQVIGNVVKNCTSDSFAGIGIYINGSALHATTEAGAGHIVIGNTVDTTTSNAISVQNCTGAKVSGNTVKNSSTVGISVDGTAQAPTITGNSVTACDQGIYLGGTYYATVTGNNIRDLLVSGSASSAALHLTSGTNAAGSTVYASYNQVVGNTIFDTRSSTSRHKRGIYEDNANCTGNTISFNQTINAQTSDISVLGTSGTYKANGTTSAVGQAPDVQVFTSSGTWTKPTGVTSVQVTCIGAGGAGGSGAQVASGTIGCGGGGGGGAGSSQVTFPASVISSPVTVTIGQGGTGGAAITATGTAGNPGSAATATTFGSYLKATFGGAGLGGVVGSGGSAGGGGGVGLTTGGAGASSLSTGGAGNSGATAGIPGGGAGGGLTASPAASAGGTGGTSGPSASNGGAGGAADNSGTAGTSVSGYAMPGSGGGGGGSSTSTTAGSGANGGTYGAGGGGGGASINSHNSGAGGNGGNGICVVTSW